MHYSFIQKTHINVISENCVFYFYAKDSTKEVNKLKNIIIYFIQITLKIHTNEIFIFFLTFHFNKIMHQKRGFACVNNVYLLIVEKSYLPVGIEL